MTDYGVVLCGKYSREQRVPRIGDFVEILPALVIVLIKMKWSL